MARRFARNFRTHDLVIPTWIERYLLSEFHVKSGNINLPLVAIVGPPRVGSTLMYQILASNTDCFFFDNLQHTLLRYPYLGFLLSQRLITKKTGDFKSDHGFIKGIGGMSEGNFFWPFWFDMNLEETSPQPVDQRLKHVQRVLDKIYEQTSVPMVNSFNSHAFYLAELKKRFSRLVIVNMRREPVANAVSLLRGRRQFRDSINSWWSIRPAHCDESGYPDPYSQIACQIIEVYKSVRQQRRLIPHVPIVDVTYDDLCDNPQSVISQILEACELAGFNLALHHSTPMIPELTRSGPRPYEIEAVRQFHTLFEVVDWDELWS